MEDQLQQNNTTTERIKKDLEILIASGGDPEPYREFCRDTFDNLTERAETALQWSSKDRNSWRSSVTRIFRAYKAAQKKAANVGVELADPPVTVDDVAPAVEFRSNHTMESRSSRRKSQDGTGSAGRSRSQNSMESEVAADDETETEEEDEDNGNPANPADPANLIPTLRLNRSTRPNSMVELALTSCEKGERALADALDSPSLGNVFVLRQNVRGIPNLVAR